MGFFKDINTLQKQAKDIQKTSTPGADMRAAKDKLRNLNAAMTAQTSALSATPENSVAGQVQIVSMAMTAGSVNGDPLLQLSVLIQGPGRPPIPFTGPIAVPAVHVHRIQTGATLPAFLNMADPTSFAFDWATASAG